MGRANSGADVREGMDADLVILDGPRIDVRAASRAAWVVRAGRLFAAADLRAVP
jgi:hypothetical protein